MVEDRITDGTRIAELLASELDGREDGPLDRIAVENADPEVEPTEGGARAYDVTLDGTVVASVYVHPEAVGIAFASGVEAAIEAAGEESLDSYEAAESTERRVRVASGAEVKGAVEVVIAVAGDTTR